MQERVKPKKKLTVEIDATLAAAAAAKGIDLSAELERALRRLLGTSQAVSATRIGLAAALEQFVAEHGRWTDGLEKL